MTIKTNADVFIKRVQEKLRVIDLDDRETHQKLTRIALLLENQTKINIRRRRLVDTGALMNSIASSTKINSDSDVATIEFGSYGVRYAAVHEYGFHGMVNVPAHSRTSSKGNVYNVRSHNRKANFPERSYIRLSLVQQRRKILQILKE